MHKTCAVSSQTESQHKEKELDMQSLVEGLLPVDSFWERRVVFFKGLTPRYVGHPPVEGTHPGTHEQHKLYLFFKVGDDSAVKSMYFFSGEPEF